MAAGRHNLTRRALLGAGVGVCVAAPSPGASAARPEPSRGTSARPEPAEGRRWVLTLAAYRRAQARVAAYKAREALLPAERRAFPCDDLEAAFARVDSLRFAALRWLLRIPAPDLAALALKLELAVADQAWELDGCEDCLAGAAADARRLTHAA